MFLTYSVLFGICFNLIINSGVVLVGAYFPNKNQALTTGLASSGMSFGSLLSNVISEVIVTRYGWRRRIQIFASIIFVIGIPCVATFKPAVINTSPREDRLHGKYRYSVCNRCLGINCIRGCLLYWQNTWRCFW
uniref:monocarboxylate transporter 14-like n=1 Tax=Ciona intestinalis TaxID=7719 RepID=UPI000EF4A246|nr:monocarboxylate transporter 14-like [Ciona intestinalis]|eukprot:XP_026696320.1 monocarboxylate transporter 14-like [Ciona intestinalis]